MLRWIYGGGYACSQSPMRQPTTKNVNKIHADQLTFGERLADRIAVGMGSWAFIITQTIIVGFWITLNLLGIALHWDSYPFILLNLLFSTQAAYAAPVIMMSQNRQAQKDRLAADLDYQVNKQAEKKIEELQADVKKILAILDIV